MWLASPAEGEYAWLPVAPSGSARRITSDLEKEHWSLPGADGRGDTLLTHACSSGLLPITENRGIVGTGGQAAVDVTRPCDGERAAVSDWGLFWSNKRMTNKHPSRHGVTSQCSAESLLGRSCTVKDITWQHVADTAHCNNKTSNHQSKQTETSDSKQLLP